MRYDGRLMIRVVFVIALAAIAAPCESAAQVVIDTVIKITNVENAYPAWSPDGSQLVFQSNRSGSSVLYVMRADGSEATPITEGQHRAATPTWSQHGDLILYVANEEGEWEDLWVVRPDGTGRRNLTRTPLVNESHPYWAPDGATIIFNATTDVSDAGNEEIYEMSIDGSGLVQRTEYAGWDTYASVSPQDNRLLWRRVLTQGPSWREGWNSEIFVSDRSGGEPTNLTRHPSFDGYPAWSPDGRRIVFASDRSGTFQLYVMDADGGNTQRLIESPGEDVRPAWSPDGSSIAFNRDRNGSIEILIARVGQRHSSVSRNQELRAPGESCRPRTSQPLRTRWESFHGSDRGALALVLGRRSTGEFEPRRFGCHPRRGG